jgi:hypothetical protein
MYHYVGNISQKWVMGIVEINKLQIAKPYFSNLNYELHHKTAALP